MTVAGRRPRILLAGLFHETNTFAEGTMTLADFRVLRGQEMWSALGDGSPLGSFLAYAKENDWDLVPAIDMRATPGPMAEPAVLELFERELAAAAQAAPGLDAIFLILHGAMATANCADVEGRLLARMVTYPDLAGLPIFGVLDLHANFSPAMAKNSTALLAYRENPHTDAAETSVRAARLLEQWFIDRVPRRTVLRQMPFVWPPTGTGTASSPMRELEQIARKEERDGIDAVNVFAGFSHADTPDTGVSYSVVYQPSRTESGRVYVYPLATAAEKVRDLGYPAEWELEKAIDDALAKGLFPTCLVEPADNIGGGAAGDGTAILRALERRGLRGSGVILNDPAAVALLQNWPLGSTREITIGGRGFRLDPGPVSLTATLRGRTDGRFTLEDPHSHLASLAGREIEMGPCAVLESAAGVLILLTSRRTPPMDLGQWSSQGIDPAKLLFIGVKAAVAHRQAYDPIARASYWVRTPGACASDLSTLPYGRIRRPIHPLDSDQEDMIVDITDDEDRRAYWTGIMEQGYEVVQKLIAFPVEECGERFASLPEAAAAANVEMLFSTSRIAGDLDRLFVMRESLVRDVMAIGRAMNERGWVLKIEDGFRTVEMQRQLGRKPSVFEAILKKCLWETVGIMPPVELVFRRAIVLIANMPKIGTHMSGSAIDISVFHRDDGREVWRGYPYLEMSEHTPMRSPYVAPEFIENRLAITAMMEAHGFIHFPFEFWHFNKGDAGAQILTGQSAPARFGAVHWNPQTNEVTPVANPLEILNPLPVLEREIGAAMERARDSINA